MTAISASAPPKLPVWQTVRASYAIVGRNLGQLVRICRVWVLIMALVYIGLVWRDNLGENRVASPGMLPNHDSCLA